MPELERRWVKFNRLLARVAQVQAELKDAIEADPNIVKLPEVIELSRELKAAVGCLTAARSVSDSRARPRSDPKLLPPSNYVSAAIKALPAAGPDVPRRLVEIHAVPTYVWPHEGRYRLAFLARSTLVAGIRRWYWGVESIESLSAE
jgi:hypothetical protein